MIGLRFIGIVCLLVICCCTSALRFIRIVCLLVICCCTSVKGMEDRPRIIVTTDGKADDRASFVRFLLTSNEFDVEAIVNTAVRSSIGWVVKDGMLFIPSSG